MGLGHSSLVFYIFFFFLMIRRPPRSTLFSLHDALPICPCRPMRPPARRAWICARPWPRSEEHTSELQSHSDLVCRLLLEKKKKNHHSAANQKTKKAEDMYSNKADNE